MFKTQLKTIGLLCSLIILITSCKKENLPTDALTGAWDEHVMNSSTFRRLVFKSGNIFTMQVWSNGSTTSEVNGIYEINGENLAVRITEDVEFNAAGKPAKTAVNRQLFEKGKFNISKDVLTIKFISYPADAPVDAEIKFGKKRAID